MKKRKILLSSILTIALCASLITGATFALFTSESSVNIAVTSGSVAVTATIDKTTFKGYTEYEDGIEERVEVDATGDTLTFGVTGGTAHFDSSDDKLVISNFAPGNGVNFNIKITNSSTIATKYRVGIMAAEGDKDLFDALEFNVKETKAGSDETALTLSSSIGGTKYSAWEELSIPAGGNKEVSTVNVDLKFGLEGGNELQGKSCSINFVVEAVQANARTEDGEAGSLFICSVNDFIALSDQVAAGNSFEGKIIELKNDVDFTDVTPAAFVMMAADVTFTPIGTVEKPFKGTFEGNNYTIKNLQAKGERAALFGVTVGATIQNVTIENATVTASNATDSAAGVLVAEAKGSLTLSNVTVTNSTANAEIENHKNIGALVGMTTPAEGHEKAEVTIENVTVTTKEDEGNFDNNVTQSDLIGGENAPEITYEGENELDIEIAEGFVKAISYGEGADKETSVYKVLNKTGLVSFANIVNNKTFENSTFKGETVVLESDIKLGNQNWTPIGKVVTNQKEDGRYAIDVSHLFQGTFDGQMHTIYDLKIDTADSGAGLFNSTENAQYKNLSIENVNINGTEYVGALVGYGYTSDYTDISVKHATLNGNHWMGGIAGGSYSSFTRCTVEDLTIVCTPNAVSGDTFDNGDKVGGLIGIDESGSFNFEECSVKDATLTAYRDVGGFVGYANVGHVNNSSIENVKIIIDRTNFYGYKDINAGAYVGRQSKTPCTIDAESQKNAEGQFTVGYGYDGAILHDVEFGYYAGSGKYYISSVTVYNAQDVIDVQKLQTVKNDVFMKENAGENLTTVNFKPVEYDFSGYDWKPLKGWRFNYFGNGATVKNITMNTVASQAGFVDSLGDGTVKDFTFENIHTVGDQVGLITGHSDHGYIENVTLKGNNSATYTSEFNSGYPAVGVFFGCTSHSADSLKKSTIAEDCEVNLYVNGLVPHEAAFKYISTNYYMGYVYNDAAARTINVTNHGVVYANADENAELRQVIKTGCVNYFEVNSEDGYINFVNNYANDYKNTKIQGLRKNNGDGAVWGDYPFIVNIMKDLDFSEKEEVAPICEQASKVDGHGNKISNVTFGQSDAGKSGLIAFAGGVKNLTLENVTAKGQQVGAFVGALNEASGTEDAPVLDNVTLAGINSFSYDTTKYTDDWYGIGAFTGVCNSGSSVLHYKVNVADGTVINYSYEGAKEATQNKLATKDLLLGWSVSGEEPIGTVNGENYTVNFPVIEVGADDDFKEKFSSISYGSTLKLMDNVEMQGYSSWDRTNSQTYILMLGMNAVLDLNDHTFTLEDTNSYSGDGFFVHNSVTSFEIKNGTVNFIKPENKDSNSGYGSGYFLHWENRDASSYYNRSSEVKDCSLKLENVKIEGTGDALYLVNGYEHSDGKMEVTIENNCKFAKNIKIGGNVNFTATNLDFGKLCVYDMNGNSHVTFNGGSFEGSVQIRENTSLSDIVDGGNFTANGTTITGDIQFANSTATLTNCVLQGRLVLQGTITTKVNLVNTKCNNYTLHGTNSILTIDGVEYTGK